MSFSHSIGLSMLMPFYRFLLFSFCRTFKNQFMKTLMKHLDQGVGVSINQASPYS